MPTHRNLPTHRNRPKRRHDTGDPRVHRYDIDRYVRQAKRFGTELVYETAAGDLDLLGLGRLSIELQAIGPKWKQPLDGVPFALTLIDGGATETAACRMAQVSIKTLRRWQRDPNRSAMRIIRRGDRPPIIEAHARSSVRPPGRMDWDLLRTMVDDEGEPLMEVPEKGLPIAKSPNLPPSLQAISGTNGGSPTNDPRKAILSIEGQLAFDEIAAR